MKTAEFEGRIVALIARSELIALKLITINDFDCEACMFDAEAECDSICNAGRHALGDCGAGAFVELTPAVEAALVRRRLTR